MLAVTFALVSCNAIGFGPTVKILDEGAPQGDANPNPGGGSTPPPSTTICKNYAELSWTKPTRNTDGTNFTNLSGYQISYGNNSRVYTATINLNDPNLSAYKVEGLSPGNRYFFSMKSVASNGAMSDYSNEAWLYLPVCN